MLKFHIDLKTKWEGDIGPIEPGIWDDILQAIPKIALSEKHRLSQIFLVHRLYRTPLFLHKIGLRECVIDAVLYCGSFTHDVALPKID